MGPTPLGWLVRLDRVLGLEAVIVAFLQNPLMQQLHPSTSHTRSLFPLGGKGQPL